MTLPGDTQLAAMLERDGVNKDVTAIVDLIDGVLASANGDTRTDWLDLVGGKLGDDLKSALLALRDERKSEFLYAKDGYDAAGRVDALRKYLSAKGVDGFVVPRSDEHQGEYVPACAERLA
ncbi:MAG TPA: X-Pro aminopeptidase, partial [Thalassospira sp.]|mgnify:FL=1|nr:X-Pro aminopeptidase [Thalassospira sp.]